MELGGLHHLTAVTTDAGLPDELHRPPLELAGRLVEEGLAEDALVREAPVEGPLADAGGA